MTVAESLQFNSLHKCIHFAYGSGVESIYDMLCRTKAIQANHSGAPCVRRAGYLFTSHASLPIGHVSILLRADAVLPMYVGTSGSLAKAPD